MYTKIQMKSHTILPRLLAFKESSNKQEFDKLLLNVLPKVRKHILKSLEISKESMRNRDLITVDDIVDELYIHAYEHIDELGHPELFEAWLIAQAALVIEDKMDEQEYDELFTTEFEKYSERDWDEMEEKYSVQADGDLELLEEFDDVSYGPRDYQLEQVFIQDNEKEWIDELDKKINNEELQRHIQSVLGRIPIAMRNTFELAYGLGLSSKQISRVRKTELEETVDKLKRGRIIVAQSIRYRFLPRSRTY